MDFRFSLFRSVQASGNAGESRPDFLLIPAPSLGQADAALFAVEQLDVEVILDQGNLPAHGGLAHVQFLGRFGGARNARISLSGRNLKWWTDFRGGDPDFANFGGTPESVQRNRELAAYPASRHFWANVQVGF